MYILCIKVGFKAIYYMYLRRRENLRFLLLSLILCLYRGNRFDQTMCECIYIFQRVKMLKYMMI